MKIDGIKNYFGGKEASGSYQQIINQIPPHDNLVVPFLGNCAVVRNIDYNKVIACELDKEVCEKWNSMDLKNVMVMNTCGIDYMVPKDISRKFNCDNTVFYLDPPYPLETRTNKRYKYDLGDEDQFKLLSFVKVLANFNFKIIISSYENEKYDKHLKNWRKVKYNSMTRGGVKEECLYISFPETDTLHDYSYLGIDFSDRDRIKRKIKRHINRLKKMEPKERNAIIESIKNEF